MEIKALCVQNGPHTSFIPGHIYIIRNNIDYQCIKLMEVELHPLPKDYTSEYLMKMGLKYGIKIDTTTLYRYQL